MRLTLRTLLAYLDDTLPPDQAKAIGQKVAESETAQELIDRIKRVTRRRGLSTPTADIGSAADPNTVADYLSDALSSEQTALFEKSCLESDVLLAESAACHQILTLLLSEPVRVPPTARQRMYQLVKGRESLPNRKPGATVPVAGELPEPAADDADDADAPYLLGMKAYSGSEPFQRMAVPLATVGGLLAALCLTVWLAWPTSRRVVETADGGPTVGTSVGQPIAAPVDPKPDPGAGKKGSAGPEKKDTQPTPPGKEGEKSAPAGDAAKPPAGELVPAAGKPKLDRVQVGRVENPDALVVTRNGDGKWVRATAKEPEVYSTDQVVVLPGYKAKLRIEPATEVELWGNVPEQQANVPVLETAVTFYPAVDGFDADMAVHTGRVYIAGKRATGVKVRLRFRGEVWDLTLPDDKAEVVVEVVNSLVRGVGRDLDPSEAPLVSVGLAVLKGTVGLKVRYKDVPEIKANEGVAWTSKGTGLQGPSKLEEVPPFRAAAYYSRYELPVGDYAKAAQEALSDLSNRAAGRDTIRVAFAELLRDDEKSYTRPREVGARLAVFGNAAVGDLTPVIDALNDGGRPFVRVAAVDALASSLAADPEGVEQFRRRIIDKLGLKEDQVALAVRLLRGVAPAERRDPVVLDQLVEALSNGTLVVRELAFAAMVRGVTDPEFPPSRPQLMYDAAAPPEVREAGVRAWKRYVEELKKKPASPKPPDKK